MTGFFKRCNVLIMELNFKTFGQGEPLIILHGLFGMLDNWQTLGKRFAEHFTVFLVDQRNHGRSPHLPDIDYPLLAADLAGFMEQNWVYKAHILGHSMGGKTAMQFALNHADMVDKLVVVDIAPRLYSRRHLTIFEALLALDLQQLTDREEVEKILRLKIDEEGTLQFLMKNLGRDKHGRFRFKMNLEALYQNYDKLLAPVSGTDTFDHPALFIRGGKSEHITDDDFPKIREMFPQAELATVAGAGHWVHADAPDELFGLVMSFFKNDR